MSSAVPLAPERSPRRARYLVPLGTPRRSELLAAAAVAAVVAGVLFAPLTLILAAAFDAVSKASRWRPLWLAVPAACGVIWALAIGPGEAAAGLRRGPAAALRAMATGPAAVSRLPAAIVHGLPGQFPLALILAAGVAAVAWWVRWLHTDEWDLPAARPGLVSIWHRRQATASLRAGRMLTRDGVRLGVEAATGRAAVLCWRDAGGGVLVTGAAHPAVLASGLRLADAAIRRRKPVIVVDLTGDHDLPGALAARCGAARAPLHVFGATGGPRYEPRVRPGAEQQAALAALPWGPRGGSPGTGTGASLADVVRQRAVALFALGGPGLGRRGRGDRRAGRRGRRRPVREPVPRRDRTRRPVLAHRMRRRRSRGRGRAHRRGQPGRAGAGAGHHRAGAGGPDRRPGQRRHLPPAGGPAAGRAACPADRHHDRAPRSGPGPAGDAGTGDGRSAAAGASHAVPLGTMEVPVVQAATLCALRSGDFVLVAGLAAARAGGAAVTVRAPCHTVSGPLPARPEPGLACPLPGGRRDARGLSSPARSAWAGSTSCCIADPGLPPRRPVPPDPERVNPGWLSAQRREENLISRPARQAAAGCALLAGVVVLLGWAGWLNPALTGLGVVTFGGLAAAGAVSAWRGRQALKAAVAAETRRVTAARAAQERDLFTAQEEHARRFRAWQGRQRAFRGQALWYPVVLPEQTDRVDLVGGTMAGWSALLTSVGVPRLAGGDAITVLDLSEGAVARDLVALAGQLRVGPLVWVLPGDLPRFDLGVGLPAAAMADILTACVSADRAAAGGHDPAPDHALLARLLEVLGDGAQICQVTAALRALAQVGDPREDVRQGRLTAVQLERITGLFGRGAADRVVIERAWALEARLRVLERLGSDPAPVPRSRLRVVAADPGGGAFGNGVLGGLCHGLPHPPAPPGPSRAAVAAHGLRGRRPGAPRGADRPARGRVRGHQDRAGRRLPVDSAARRAAARPRERGAGGDAPRQRRGRQGGQRADRRAAPFRAEPAHRHRGRVRQRHRRGLLHLHRGHGAVGSPRPVAQRDIGAQPGPRPHPPGRLRRSLPRCGSDSTEVSESRGTSDSDSITDGINTSTSWGVTTSRAIGLNESLGRTVAAVPRIPRRGRKNCSGYRRAR